MNKDGKIFGKINIIDFFVILIVLLAIAGISIRFISPAGKEVTEGVKFSYSVKIENIRYFAVEALEKKGTVTDNFGNIIGEIKSIEHEEYKEKTMNNEGESIEVVVPERYTVILTVEAEGKESDDAFFVGENLELCVGGGIDMHTKYSNCSGKVIDIKKI